MKRLWIIGLIIILAGSAGADEVSYEDKWEYLRQAFVERTHVVGTAILSSTPAVEMIYDLIAEDVERVRSEEAAEIIRALPESEAKREIQERVDLGRYLPTATPTPVPEVKPKEEVRE